MRAHVVLFALVGCRATDPAPAPTTAAAIARGPGEHTICSTETFVCAITNAGRVACWGELVRGKVTPTPTLVAAIDRAEVIACSPWEICALSRGRRACVENAFDAKPTIRDASGATRLWVGNETACVGTPRGIACDGPIPAHDVYGGGSEVPHAIDGASEISLGTVRSCVLAGDETRCFENDELGEHPMSTVTQHGLRRLDVGRFVTCGLQGETVACFGPHQSLRELRGDEVLTQFPILGPATDVSTGDHHVCALSRDGHVRCLGTNGFGELGTRGSGDDVNAMIGSTIDLPPVTELALGMWHSCARTGTGDVYCWGGNDRGELGDGTTTSRSMPRRVRLP